jgi:hypothetical protein
MNINTSVIGKYFPRYNQSASDKLDKIGVFCFIGISLLPRAAFKISIRAKWRVDI